MQQNNQNIKLINPIISRILKRMGEENILEEANQITQMNFTKNNPKTIKFAMKCEAVKLSILEELDEEKAPEEEKNIVKNYFKNLGGF